MDPIADVFTAMRVESAVYGRLEATAPWGIAFEGGPFAAFGMVSRGNCWLTLEGNSQPIPLTGGDCIWVAPGHAYALRDDPRTPTVSAADLLNARTGDTVNFGGGGAPTTIIGGKFTFDPTTSKPLIDLLPPLIHIEADQARALALRTTLELLASETAAPSPGSQVVINRLADILFIQALRAYIASKDCCRAGWLRALSDRQIGAALKSIHERIGEPWTVAALASSAGMSRSAFALRFKELVGEPPLEYLTRWRMYKASRLLSDRDRKLAEVAKLVGYDSDGAFNKAFKRVLGVTPGEHRKNGDSEVTQVAPRSGAHRAKSR